jgi:hypothetical protein
MSEFDIALFDCKLVVFKRNRDHHGGDRMIVGFTATYAISAITLNIRWDKNVIEVLKIFR